MQRVCEDREQQDSYQDQSKLGDGDPRACDVPNTAAQADALGTFAEQYENEAIEDHRQCNGRYDGQKAVAFVKRLNKNPERDPGDQAPGNDATRYAGHKRPTDSFIEPPGDVASNQNDL